MATKRFEPQVQLDNGLKMPTGVNNGTAGVGKVLQDVTGAGDAEWTSPNTVTNTVARAYRNAALTTNAASNTKITIDTISFDASGNMDVTTNHRYNIPYSGYYSIFGQVSFATNPGEVQVLIFKNGTLASIGTDISATGTFRVSVADILQCNAGDYIELFTWTQSSVALSVAASYDNHLAVAQISGVQTYQSLATAARGYRNASLTISGNTRIPIDTIAFDPGNNLSVTNGRYTAPATGYYQVNGAAWITTTAGSEIQARLYVNGSLATLGTDIIPATQAQVVVSNILSLNAGDYVELYVYASGTATLDVGVYYANYLSVVQVGGANTVGNLSPTAQSANYTAGTGQLVLMSGSNTVTFPSAPIQGAQIAVQALSGNVTLNHSGTDTFTNFGTTGATSIVIGNGGSGYFTYLNGVWYATLDMPNVSVATPNSTLQNGVVNSGDLAISTISVNGSTGALTFTLAAASPAWIKNTGGVLMPVYYAGATYTITPSTLPANGQYSIVGIEMDTSGTITLSAGTPQTHATTTVPAVDLLPAAGGVQTQAAVGKLRIADIGLYNSTGTYAWINGITGTSANSVQGTTWIDRRPWARGALRKRLRTSNAAGGNDYSTTSTSLVSIDATNMVIRLECTGNPMRMRLIDPIALNLSAATSDATFQPWIDGAVPSEISNAGGVEIISQSSAFTTDQTFPPLEWIITPTTGSHTFQWAWRVSSGTGTLYCRANISLVFYVEEIMRQDADNGSA